MRPRDEIESLMRERGWNQSALARALGVGRASVSRWLSDDDDNEPEERSLRLIRAYRRRPGLTPDELDLPTAA